MPPIIWVRPAYDSTTGELILSSVVILEGSFYEGYNITPPPVVPDMLLLEGASQVSGIDHLLLEGDQQSGSDRLLLE